MCVWVGGWVGGWRHTLLSKRNSVRSTHDLKFTELKHLQTSLNL